MARNTSIEKRLAQASQKQDAALGLFEQAAASLNTAADEHAAVAQDARERAAALQRVSNEADQKALKAASAASKILDLIGK